MKTSEIRNVHTLAKQAQNYGAGTFHVGATSNENLLKKCRANVIELEPGSVAYDYHYHENNEEIFYIIEGEGVVELADAEHPVKAGDIISFPTGKGGVHVIKNTSADQKLLYVDFSTHSDVEVAHLPKSDKIMVISQEIFSVFDKPKQ